MDFNIPGLSDLNLRMILTSVIIFGVIAAIFGSILYASGISGTQGVFIWILFSLAMIGIQWYLGPVIIKFATGAKEVKKEEQSELHGIIERLAKLAEIPKPKIYIVNNPTPNAFAFGRTQSDSNIAVHSGILQILNKEELEGVLAHEIGHIKHRDVIIMTLASVVPVILYYAALIFLGGRNDRNRSIGSFIGVWIGAMVAQFIGQLLVLWISRSREYCADAFAAYATRKPTSLMSALAKVSYEDARIKATNNTNSAVSTFYFSNPSAGEAKFSNEVVNLIAKGNEKQLNNAIEEEKKHGGFELIRTHPLTYKRLDALNRIKKQIGA